MKPYIKFLLDEKWRFITAVACGIIAAWASGFGLPFMISKVFPVVFDNTQMPEVLQEYVRRYVAPENLQMMLVFSACLLMPIVFIIRGIASFFNVYLLSYVSFSVLEKLRMKVFDRLQILPLAFHEQQRRGDLLSRVMGDTQALQAGITQVANDLMIQPMTLIGALSYLVYKSIESQQAFILLINLIAVAVTVFPIRYFGRKMMKRAKLMQQGNGLVTSILQENLASQREIRAYKMESVQSKMFLENTRRVFKEMLKMVRYRQFQVPIIEIVCAVGVGFALFQGNRSGMDQGTFVSLAAALYMCYEPVKRLGNVHNVLKQAQASLERLEFIVNQPDTMPDPENPIELPQGDEDISFDKVDFSYDGEHATLSQIDLTIPRGQIVALVGPSGAGKSTFASLIPRFYDPVAGSVKIGSVDVRQVRKADLREKIAIVSQHPVLFRGTIADNIRIGRPHATNEEVIQAAQMASVHEFVSEMPEGYKTMIGESGEGLSGGQRQRVSIARAFLKNAPILIMDEATASLDAESEAKIQGELNKLLVGRTAFIIAHRFSTIRIADRIIVFEHGHIVGDGTHESLYDSVPLYKDLYDRQIME